LSLLRFSGKEDAGVLELGANHNKEIHVLSNIVKPDISIVTNIGYAHIGYFGSLANIADAKFEIVDGMKKDGLLFLCGDDPLLVKKGTSVTQKVVYYGTKSNCSVRAKDIVQTKKETLRFTVDNDVFEIPMQGRHFIYAALAAIAVAKEFGLTKKQINTAFALMEPVSMRGAIKKKVNATFIVDCYNANPSSMKSSIQMLADVAGKKSRVAIVGDMLELGKYSTRLHTALGCQLAASGVDRIIAVGALAKRVIDGARKNGMAVTKTFMAKTSEEAIPLAKKCIRKGDVVLLKGSRGIHLETVFEGI
jgi:UDP-N-acetylmuramoyl-tripeptide--D-alanyl-D-alanine ligase